MLLDVGEAFSPELFLHFSDIRVFTRAREVKSTLDYRGSAAVHRKAPVARSAFDVRERAMLNASTNAPIERNRNGIVDQLRPLMFRFEPDP